MPGILTVRLGESPVGTIANVADDANIFAFTEEYAADPNRPTLTQGLIDPAGRLISEPQTRRIAPPFFSNLLPEAHTPLRKMLARQHRINATRDFPYLRVLGADLPGNVIVVDEHAATEPDDSSRGDDLDANLASAADDMATMRFSLAGVQLKFSASMRGNRLTLPASGEGGSWIVKMPNALYPHLTENEFAAMEFARDVGLTVPPLRLLAADAIGGLPEELQNAGSVFAIARFDRQAGGRIHYEDFCQIGNLPPSEKYDEKNMEWVFDAFARLCPSDDLDELVRRFVFGVAIGNDDMHLKNWAVIYPDGRSTRIAPAYDFVPTRRYTNSPRMALAMDGDNRWERLAWASLMNCSAKADMRPQRVAAVAAETIERIRSAWPQARERFTDRDAIGVVDRQLASVPLLREPVPKVTA